MPKKIRLASKSRMECSIKTGSNVRKVANNTLSPGTKRRKNQDQCRPESLKQRTSRAYLGEKLGHL